MALQDYGVLVKGGVHEWTVVLIGDSAWPVVAASTWTWKMLIAARDARGTAAASLTSASEVISTTTVASDTLTLIFGITASVSDGLTAGAYFVEIEGAEADATEHYYGDAHGELTVRAPEGGG